MRQSLLSIESLVEELEKLFPDIMAMEDSDAFERGRDAGKVELIKYIKTTYLEEDDYENHR